MDTSPHTPEEIKRWAHQRRPHEREPVPAIGERLLLREEEFGEAVPAIVAAVQDLDTPGCHWNQHGGLVATRGPGQPDPSVWSTLERCPAGHWQPPVRDDCLTCGAVIPDGAPVRHELHGDPWPWVHVQVILGQDDDGNDVLAPPRWCKEARVRGSAGWLRESSRFA